MRLLGGLFAVMAFFLYGTSRANASKEELNTLGAMLSFLRELSLRLVHRREKLGDVFATCKNPFPHDEFLQVLREHGGQNYPGVWRAGLQTLSLPKEAIPPLHVLGDSLGQLLLRPQTEQLELCIARLEELQKSLQQNALQKQKSTVALWTLGGLLTALLLL